MKLEVEKSTPTKLPQAPEKPLVPKVSDPSIDSLKAAFIDESFEGLNTAFEAENPEDKQTGLKPGEFLAGLEGELVGNEDTPVYKSGLFDLAVEGE